MAFVHPTCLKLWLQAKNQMHCELCKCEIRSHLRLRKFAAIWPDLVKQIKKKLLKDKLLVIKCFLYSLYIFLSAKKAVNCFKLLFQQMRSRHSSLSFNVLSILYLVFVLLQVFMIYTSEAAQIYRKIKLKLKLICYEITFINKL